MYPVLLAASMSGKISTWAAEYREYLETLNWTQVATVVIAGIGIVLAVLIAFVCIFKAYGFVITKTGKKSKSKPKADKKKDAPSPAPARAQASVPAPSAKAASAPPAPVVQQGISGEIVAAITAAIAASEGGPVSIRAIKVKNVAGRNPWAAAAIADNARPF